MLKRALQICKELSLFVHIKRLTSPTRAFAVHRLQITKLLCSPKGAFDVMYGKLSNNSE